MAFEVFQKKQKMLTELMEALKRIEEALPELTKVEMDELLFGITQIIAREETQLEAR